MSIGALTTLAAVRDNGRPTKQDVGKAAAPDMAEEQASLTDVRVTPVPTELVAPYTAVTAAIVGAVARPFQGRTKSRSARELALARIRDSYRGDGGAGLAGHAPGVAERSWTLPAA
jgi:hypothetical protein